MTNLSKVLGLCVALLLSIQLEAQLEIELEQVASGLSSPVDITHAGDARLFIVERSGTIRILDGDGTLLADDFLDINSRVINTDGQSEQGLLGLAFHSDYANNGYFFVHYTANNGNGVVARFSVDPNAPNLADEDSEVQIMTFDQPYSNHNGGCLKFGPDGYLYIGLGDGGSADDPGNRSQDPQTLLGKMLRIDIDSGDPYSVPADNPFVDNDEVLDEIWAIGLRNPWRYSFDKETGDLWIGDVGQNKWEEINKQPANSTGGENYGWRCYEGFNDFLTNGCQEANQYVTPIIEYNHQGFTHCSVTGGFVYRGTQYPDLIGKYLYNDYCSGRFWASSIFGASQEVGSFPGYDISTFGEGFDGELYVARLTNGRIYKIKTPCPADGSVEIIQEGDGFSVPDTYAAYQWYNNGSAIAGATASSHSPQQGGEYYVEITDASGCVFLSTSDFVLGTASIPTVDELSVSPNPVTKYLSIELATSQKVTMNIGIFDVRGTEVFTRNIEVNGQVNQQLDLADLAAGVYVLRFKTTEGAMSQKIIK